MKTNSLTVSSSRSREHGLFTWETLFSVVTDIRLRLPEPWRNMILTKNSKSLAQEEINTHLCSATIRHRHCERAGQEIIESIGSSIIIRSYISGMCGCSKLGLERAAFFIHSSTATTR